MRVRVSSSHRFKDARQDVLKFQVIRSTARMLRASYAMVQVGAGRAYVIDFDWAGREGEVRYQGPNPDFEWPRPAAELNGQLITKDHDTYMLERLLEPPKLKRKNEEKNENKQRHTRDGEVENRKRRWDD